MNIAMYIKTIILNHKKKQSLLVNNTLVLGIILSAKRSLKSLTVFLWPYLHITFNIQQGEVCKTALVCKKSN